MTTSSPPTVTPAERARNRAYSAENQSRRAAVHAWYAVWRRTRRDVIERIASGVALGGVDQGHTWRAARAAWQGGAR